MATSTPDDRRRVKLPRSLPDRSRPQPYSRVDAPYFRSPGFFVRIGGLAVLVAVVIGVLVLRAWSIQILHGPQYTSIANSQSFRVVDLTASRGAIVDSHGRPLAGTTGHRGRRCRPERARHDRRARPLEPNRRGDEAAPCALAACGSRAAHARHADPPLGAALAVRAGRRHLPPEDRPRRLPRGARVELSRLQGDVGALTHLSAGRARRRVPRAARRGESERARDEALRPRAAGADRRADRRRGNLRLDPQPRLPPRASARRLAGKDRRPAGVRARQDAADAEADDRRADPARRREGDPRRDGARAGERPRRRDVGRGGRDEPAHRRHLRARELSDVQPGGGGGRPRLPELALPLDEREPAAAEPRDAGPLSDRLDVQADRRRGGADAGADHAGDQSALQRLVHARQLHLPQRRGGRLLVHVAAHGARGVVRHLVLPARQPLLPPPAGRPRPRDPVVGAHARARAADRRRSRPARWAASCRRPRG